MKRIIFIILFTAFLLFNGKSKAQVLKSENDSTMERSITRILSNKFNTLDCSNLQCYSFLFVINYDSITKDYGKVSVDTFFGGSYSLSDRITLNKDAQTDTSKYSSIISKYHPSKSLSVFVPYFLYPNASLTKDSSTFFCKDITRLMLQCAEKFKKYYLQNREIYFAKPYIFEYWLPVR